jgi:hypothetical protein
MGFEVELFDILDGESDISDDAIYQQLHDRITAGEFFAIFAAPPCSTVSVSRFIVSPTASDGGAPIVRNRQNRMVMPNASDAERREAEAANLIFERTAALLLAAWLAGTHWSLENPADRGDPMRTKLFMTKQHCPIFLLDMFIELSKRTGAEQVTFPMCAFGSEWQKYTTLLFSPGFSTWFRPLAKLMCSHKVHGATAGGIKDDAAAPTATALAALLTFRGSTPMCPSRWLGSKISPRSEKQNLHLLRMRRQAPLSPPSRFRRKASCTVPRTFTPSSAAHSWTRRGSRRPIGWPTACRPLRQLAHLCLASLQ